MIWKYNNIVAKDILTSYKYNELMMKQLDIIDIGKILIYCQQFIIIVG